MFDELFPDEFIRGLQHLRIIARHRVYGVDRGEHTARKAGSGLDFRDYRPYVPGDDLRRVDWNVYRRTRRLTTRLYDEVERLPVHMLVDVSASMFFETPPRANAARQVAAAVAACALNQHDRITIYPFGEDLGSPIRLPSGRALPQVLSGLASLGPMGVTDFVRSLGTFRAQRPKRGVIVIVSDFFDPDGIDAVLSSFGESQHRLSLVQMVREMDRNPDAAGDVRLLDCEHGEPVELQVNAETLTAYQAAYDRFQSAIESFCAERQAILARIDSDVSVLDQLHRLFPAGVFQI